MTETPKEYPIRTVLDFLTVPAEKREACLRDFARFLAIVEPSQNVLNAIADEMHPGVVAFRVGETFTWIDDDGDDVTLGILNPDGSEAGRFNLTEMANADPSRVPAPETDHE